MLILVRHGETQANHDRKLLGRLDLPLTELGVAQAAALADAARPARVIASPLLRTRTTAATFGLPVEIDDRFIEVDYGIYDGRKLDEVPREIWQAWRQDPEFVPEGGESMASVARRVQAACRELLAGPAVEQDVVVVSHVSPIKAAVAWAVGLVGDVGSRMFLDVASVSRIGGTAEAPVLRSFNETGHLAGLG